MERAWLAISFVAGTLYVLTQMGRAPGHHRLAGCSATPKRSESPSW